MRTDEYGGSFENRVALPAGGDGGGARRRGRGELPLFLRISATDWAPGGWTVEDSVALAKLAQRARGGPDRLLVGRADAAAEDRARPGVSGAVRGADPAGGGRHDRRGRDDHDARAVRGDRARRGRRTWCCWRGEFLRDPYFAGHAAKELGVEFKPPKQYLRAW